jgi:Protein of unknown function (DUF3040)
MLSERDRRILDALERRTGAEDPGLARLLAAGPQRWTRWRRLGRRLITTPALILAVILGITACSLHVSALGMLFFLWALAGIVARHRVPGHDMARMSRGSPDQGHRAGWS